jgi:hypothetical protein
VPGNAVTGKHSQACIALQGLDVDVAEKFGGVFASDQWFEGLPRLIDCAHRRCSGKDFDATSSVSACGHI